jgi:hypothetical protein
LNFNCSFNICKGDFEEIPEDIMNETSPTATARLIEAYKNVSQSGEKKLAMGRLIEYWKSPQAGTSVASKTSALGTGVIEHKDPDTARQIKEAYLQSSKEIAEEEAAAQKELDDAQQVEKEYKDALINLIESEGDRSASKAPLVYEMESKLQTFSYLLEMAMNKDAKTLGNETWENLVNLYQQVSTTKTRYSEDLESLFGSLKDLINKLHDLGFDLESFRKKNAGFFEESGLKRALASQSTNRAKARLKEIAKNKKILARIGEAIHEELPTGQVLGSGVASQTTGIEKEQVTHPSKTTPQEGSQKITPNASQAVYSLANGKALLIKNETGYTIALKVPPNRYVKFRNLKVVEQMPTGDEKNWLGVGNPPVFYIHVNNLMENYSAHENPKYGDKADIFKAATDFISNVYAPVTELAVSPASLQEGKIAVEMDNQGAFRIVVRKEVGRGTYKKIYEETLMPFGPDSKKFARGKLGDKEFSEDPEELKNLKEEIEFSQILQAAGVPNILVMQAGKGQNINKVRAEMPLVQGDLASMVMNEEITPEVIKKRLKYMLQIAKAVEGIHGLEYAYCDLKLPNFLLDKENDTALLADFGLVKRFGEFQLPGTYPAPECASECVNDQPALSAKVVATPQNDCWAFGIALFAALYGRENLLYTYNAAFASGKAKILQVGQKICEFVEKTRGPAQWLIQQLLSKEPLDRPSMKAVVVQLQDLLELYEE